MSESKPSESTRSDAAPLRAHAHTPWTRHVLNTGTIFSATYEGVSKLPRGVSYGLGHVGTWLTYRLMPEMTGALMENLAPVLPDASEQARRRIALATYRSYAKDVIDFLRSLSVPPVRARELFAHDAQEGRSVLSHLLDARKGVLLVSGHFGNWELGAVMLRAFDHPLTIVAMQEASEEINRMRREFRDRLGVDTLEVRQSMDTALQIRRRLADNRIVAMLMDRHVDRDRVAVTLFGRRAYFLRTPALLGYLTGAPLLPCAIVRQPNGIFKVTPGTPIWVSREGDRETAVATAAQAFATQLEAWIRETPQCWYQFYRYWDQQEPQDRRSA